MESSRRTSDRRRRILASILSTAVVVFVFAGLLPQFADLREVWDILLGIDLLDGAAMLALALAAVIVYSTMYAVAIQDLSPGHALAIHSMATAVANTVPAGGAVGLGVWLASCQRLGLTVGSTSLGLILVGIWDFVSRLAVPAFVALGARLLGIDETMDLGVLVSISVGMVAVIVVVWEVLRSDRWASRAGRLAEAARGRLPERWRWGPPDLPGRLVELRHEASGTVSSGWWKLTLAMSAVHVLRLVVLLMALRAVGLTPDDVPFSSVILAYALMQLVIAIPITPGGAGLAELSLTAVITAGAGGLGEPVVAAVLVFRMLVWFLPVVMGGIAWVWWRWTGRSAASPEPMGSAGGEPSAPDVPDRGRDDGGASAGD